jgi:hypothetical protein
MCERRIKYVGSLILEDRKLRKKLKRKKIFLATLTLTIGVIIIWLTK